MNMIDLLDEEIAHITHAVRLSVFSNGASPILSVSYWRQRLHRLLESPHLTKTQLRKIDTLLLELEKREAQPDAIPASRKHTDDKP
jgi:hypothetical protein